MTIYFKASLFILQWSYVVVLVGFYYNHGTRKGRDILYSLSDSS